MHIHFVGIGGTGIGPLALIAKQAGYEVSGTDKQDSSYVHFLKSQGISDIEICNDAEQIERIHKGSPIDWVVYSSAVLKENAAHPEIEFCKKSGIKISKRDELLNKIIEDKQLKLIAVAGTHGKTTTSAMCVWLMQKLGLPISYSFGAKTSFAQMGEFNPAGKYFIYECDEYDRNFLSFKPFLSLISGVSWDHHEIYPTQEDYSQAFRDFIAQSESVFLWQREASFLELTSADKLGVLDDNDERINSIELAGRFNREDAWLVVSAVAQLSGESVQKLANLMKDFPGVQRRFEKLSHNLYSDYAHTPEKILGAMSVALELAEKKNQNVVVVYEPLTNRRMHFLKEAHRDVFVGAKKVYWLPSYLAREDSTQAVLSPSDLVKYIDPRVEVVPSERSDELWEIINDHTNKGDMVVCMAGGGGDSLDEWLREELK